MLLLFALTAVAAEPVTKTFTLTDGTVITGQVIDESETAYLVRVGDKTVRVAYSTIASAAALTPIAAPSTAVAEPRPVPSSAPSSPLPAPVTYASRDGVRFPSAGAMLDYDRGRLELEVRDETVGTWSSTSGAVAVAVTSNLAVAREQTEGGYRGRIVAAYRIATGEGIVLATFRGETLQEGTRIFRYLRREAEYVQHGHWEGDGPEVVAARRGKRAAGIAMFAGGVAATVGSIVWMATQEEESAPPYVLTVLGVGAFGTGIGFVATTPPTMPREWVLDPWRLDEVMVYVRAWNDGLRTNLGAL